MVYNTALKKPELEPKDKPSLDYFLNIQGNYGFALDLEKDDLPKITEDCDIFYLEPPWRSGYDIFAGRQGRPLGGFYAFVAHLGTILRGIKKPIIVMCSKQDAKLYPTPNFTFETEIKVHHSKCLGLVYNMSQPDFDFYTHIMGAKTNVTLIKQLSLHFNFICDLTCGYGSAVLEFKNAGKNFVAIDSDPRCVGYIHNQL